MKKLNDEGRAAIGRMLLEISTRFEALSRIIQDDAAFVRDQLEDAPQRRSKKPTPPSASSAVWAAYEAAFVARYNQQPLRNARVNAQLKQLVGLVGEPEAIALAQFYVRSNQSFYTQSRHPVGLMVKDHHRLMIDRQMGRSVSHIQARDLEHASTNVDVAKDFLNSEDPF